MHFSSVTSLLAVLATTSVLTAAAPLQWARANNNSNTINNNSNNNNNIANELAQFEVACQTVGIAGNLTFQAIGQLNKIQTNNQDVLAQLKAVNDSLTTAFNSGETARPVCSAPDQNNLGSQFVTACDAINIAGTVTGNTITLLNQIQSNDQNVANQVEVLKATMNGVNTAGQVASSVCAGVNTNENTDGNNSNNNNNNSNNGNSSNGSSSNNNNNSSSSSNNNNNSSSNNGSSGSNNNNNNNNNNTMGSSSSSNNNAKSSTSQSAPSSQQTQSK
ncbi:hypothetical protein C8R45DRAFT_122238 [Mycena sanguinolenta]|nr:hypothetical protein C8R45DRAFT_122238 [Mycena sanguinolenta]